MSENNNGKVYRDELGLHDGSGTHPFDLTDDQLLTGWMNIRKDQTLDGAIAQVTYSSELGKRGYTLTDDNVWVKKVSSA